MTTPQKPNSSPKKNKGLIIGLIVGASLLVLACIVIASIAFINGVFKDLNIQGLGDPRKNTALIQRVEAYKGVEKATITCSNPVPWDFQSCALVIEVARDISSAQVRDVVSAYIPSIRNGDLGKTPRGIKLTVNNGPFDAPIQSTTIINNETLNEAIPLFLQVLEDPSVSALRVDYQTNEYSAISLLAQPSYGAMCEKAKIYSQAVKTMMLQHGTYPIVSMTKAVIGDASGPATCATLLQYADTFPERNADIRSIYTTNTQVRLSFRSGVSEEARADAKARLSQVLVGTSLTVAE